MDYDFNSSINLRTSLNIPRSKSITDKDKDKEKANISNRKKSNNKSISITNSISRRYSKEKVYKNSLDTNIQVHIRVIRSNKIKQNNKKIKQNK